MTRAEQVIAVGEAHLGDPYVFGAWGEECTPANRRRRMRDDHPTIKSKCQVLSGKASTCEGCKWAGGALMFDCRGFTYWCLKQVGIVLAGQGATSQYNTTANWAARGKIADMPDLVCCVFKYKDGKMLHTGLYIPWKKKFIDCSSGVTYRTAAAGWTHYAIPKGLYSDEEIQEKGLASLSSVYPTIKRGSTGEAVRKAQELLNMSGYSAGEADGVFGAKTLAAVKNYQAANGLTSDGVIGPMTWTSLLAIESADGKTYTITISGLDKSTADSLKAVYTQAVIT